jgi:hypothetical protein
MHKVLESGVVISDFLKLPFACGFEHTGASSEPVEGSTRK